MGVACALMLMSIVIFIVMSGVGYGYLRSDVTRHCLSVNLKVMFGCGIGVGLVLIIVIWCYFSFPRFFIHYVLTFPVLITMCILYIVYTRPSEVDKCLDSWDTLWSLALLFTQLQVENECCGWWNSTDRGMNKCRMTYRSGCRGVIQEFLEPRFRELNKSAIVVLCLFTACGICMTTVIHVTKVRDFWDFFDRFPDDYEID